MLSWFKGKGKSAKPRSNKKTISDSADVRAKSAGGGHNITKNVKSILMGNSMDVLHYNISNGKEKRLMIFNHKEYDEEIKFSTREGSDKDCDRLIQCFSALGFISELCNDFTSQEIKNKIEEASELESSDINCIVVIVMTRGLNNVLYAKNGKYSVDRILMPFVESQTLAGVPKLFFIQAQPSTSMATDSSGQVCMIPKHADILWTFSSIEDNVSLEGDTGCNVFIQTLCKYLDEVTCKTYNILQILAMINRSLITSLTSHNPVTPKETTSYIKVNLPSYKSTLTKLLKLNYLHGTVELVQEEI